MKIIRTKFNKEKDMIYISHLDLQKLLQRAFRRAQIDLVYSQGFNPHPKISYGNAIALGTESYGEYFDVEIACDIQIDEYIKRMNETLPEGIKFLKAIEIDAKTESLSSIIEYGKYRFIMDNEKSFDYNYIFDKVKEFMGKEEIIITKKNKKGKLVEVNIRELIKEFKVSKVDEKIVFEATLSTGSKANLNTNIFIPKILEVINLDIDPLDVDIIREDLYKVENDKLVTPM